MADKYTPRLLKLYRERAVPALQQKFGLSNALAAPRLEKIVVNMGLGKSENQAAMLEAAARDLATITGQKALVTRAKKSIAGFKLRQGEQIGMKVTLRGHRMWEFMDRLVSVAVPRVRDFRGLSSTSFDAAGNYSMGLTEQTVFPEVEVDKVEKVLGMDITFVITNSAPERSRELLLQMGMPLRREGE